MQIHDEENQTEGLGVKWCKDVYYNNSYIYIYIYIYNIHILSPKVSPQLCGVRTSVDKVLIFFLSEENMTIWPRDTLIELIDNYIDI